MSGRGLEIAVTGMAGRFPGAAGLAELWDGLCRGVESIARFDRRELLDGGVDPLLLDHPNFVPAGAVLDGADLFDAGLFGMSRREAELLDPQQRLLLECAWEALERAGHGGERPGPVGVFVGVSPSTWLAGAGASLAASLGRAQLDLAGNRDFPATRLAYKLDLHGPAVNVQTACSTSLVAIHLAASSLLAGDCDLALAGGASVRFPERSGYLYREGGIGSPDGRCRPFSEDARGTVAGAGAALVVLRRLADALDDGDPIHAVLRGSAFNNDGGRKVGYTAPSVDGQAEVIRAALALAEVDPATIGYVEAHGTATPLGDPIEVAALKQAFGAAPAGGCAIGSIKGNLGHLDAAAGVAGFVKAVLAVREGRIPPTLDAGRPSPALGLDGSPFRLAAAAEWPDRDGPRRAGVSSFGIGGTNAHAVIEQPPPPEPPGPSRPRQLLVLSAATESALGAAAGRLAGRLEGLPGDALADVAATLARGRRAFAHRAALVAADPTRAAAALRGDAEGLVRGRAPEGSRAVAFLFPGQGAQRPGAGRGLYRSEPAFRRTLDRCAEAAGPIPGGAGLLDLLLADPGDAEAARRLTRTAAAQPALFALEMALAALWREWGIEPQAVLGHSVGEYAAACVAGVFSLEDGAALVAERGRLMDSLPPGAMLAVPLAAAEVEARLGSGRHGDGLAVAAINGPRSTVVSGPEEAIERLAAELAAERTGSRRLVTSHAFHGPAMEPVAATFAERLAKVPLAPPEIPLASNLTGTWLTAEQATDPGYWVRHLLRPVRFADGVAALAEEPARVFLEVGPGRTLTSLVRRNLGGGGGGDDGGRPAVATLPGPARDSGGPDESESEIESVLGALAELWLAGAGVDWRGFYAGQRRRRIELPPYPFERRRYRPEPAAGERATPGDGPERSAAGAPPPASGNEEPAVAAAPPSTAAAGGLLYRPAWTEARPAAPEPAAGWAERRWLILADRGGVGERLASRLTGAGGRVDRVTAAASGTDGWPEGGLADLGGGCWSLDPSRPEGFRRLAAALGGDAPLGAVVHLWGLDAAAGELAGGAFDEAAERGFWSLERLAAALAEGGSACSDLAWTVVTRGAAAVTGDEPPGPASALLLGSCSSLSHRPGWSCRAVDVVRPADASGGEPIEALSGRLLAEIAAAGLEPPGDPGPLIALRGRRRWRRRLVPVEAAPGGVGPGADPGVVLPRPGVAGPEPAGAGLRAGGVYWITGGLGGVGLALAGHLAGRVRARLVLTGRTPVPERGEWERLAEEADDPGLRRRLRRLLGLEAAGAELLVAPADVTRGDQMAAVLERARSRWGAVHGVIHAAGGAAAAEGVEGEAATAALLAAKVDGTRVLLDLVDAPAPGVDPVDFVALCSSLASLRGGPSSGYCAASAFLDGVAEARAGRTPRVVSIGWDTWREDGAAAEALAREGDPGRRRRLEAHLAGALATADACRAFERALAAGEPHVAITARGQGAGGGEAAWGGAAANRAGASGAAAGPASSTLTSSTAPPDGVPDLPAGAAEVASASASEAALAAIWQELLGRPVAPDDDFFQLGGDSLLATQLMTRIQDRFGADLPLAAIFEAPTVRRLAERVEAAGAPGDGAGEAAGVAAGAGGSASRPASSARPESSREARAAVRETPLPPVPPRIGSAAPPAARPVELSLGQQRLWFLDRLEPGSAAYHLPGAFRLGGDLDVAALAAAFTAVVERHEALRTRFPADPEGRAAAVAEPPRPFPLPLADLGALPAGRRLPEALRLAAGDAAAPFDLAAGPPIRAALVRLGTADHALLLNLHHIVADLWSMGVLLRELAALYDAARARRRSPLPPLPLQYGDWAARQRRELTGERLAAQAAYWKRLLGGELPVLELPADRPRPRSLSGRGRRVPVALAAGASRALVERGRERGATLFMTVAAAWAALLHRYGGQRELVIGFPIAGRRSRDSEPLIGFFVNTLVLRLELSAAMRFEELLALVQRRALEAFAHQDLPFERLVEQLDLPRDLSRTPLFQAMVSVLNAPHALPELPGLEWRPLPLAVRAAQFDVSLDLADDGGRVRGTLEAAADLFDATTAARMAAHLAALAAAAAERPETPVGELPMLSAAERHQLQVEWRGEGRAEPGTVIEWIAARAAAAPDRIAVEAGTAALGYGELLRRADALAGRLADRGIGVESRVGVLAERSPEVIVALLAIHRAGAAYLPLAPESPRRRIALLIADAGVELVLAGAELAGRLPAEVERWSLDRAAAVPAGGSPQTGRRIRPPVPPPPEAAAYVIYTSGSTGEPKGVAVSHGALAAFVAAVGGAYPFAAGDRVLQFAPLGFDISVEEIFVTLAAGATLALRDDAMIASPADFLAACERRAVTVADLPTSYWHELAAAAAGGAAVPAALRMTIGGGEQMLAARAGAWRRATGPGRRLINSYGPTEATVAAVWAEAGGVRGAGAGEPIGRPLASARVDVVERRALGPAPAGVVGEIAIGGPALARGYLGRPAATAERFVPDPRGDGGRLYLTGDLGRRLADGEIEYVGRTDHQVKVRGYRIELGEVEAALLGHPGVEQASAAVRSDPAGRSTLVAWVAPRVDPASLRERLAARLPPYQVPAAFVVLEELPRTPSGKVDRRALPEPEAAGAARTATVHRAPEGPVEERLAAIWQRVLGVDRVGRDDNFFDLGGDSILSIQIVAAAAREGLRLAPRQLFEHQTVAALAAAAAGASAGEPGEAAEQGPVTGPAPLTPIQRWFLDPGPAEPHHFNQSLLLSVDRALAPPVLAGALTALAAHHDALRSRFEPPPGGASEPPGGGWRCAVAAPGPVPFAAVDLAALPPGRRGTAFAAAAAALERTLDLGAGPLFRGVRADLGEVGCRLLIVAHHLVVDGVSWRVLSEDLRAAVAALAAGRRPRLPAKTVSFRRWAERLAERAGDPALAAEVEQATAPAEPAPLPLDRWDGADDEGSTRTVRVRLDAGETAALLRRGAAGAGVEPLLLAALAEALAPWAGAAAVSVDREAHGREPEAAGGADVSRTVGWFTAIHPLRLDLAPAATGAGAADAAAGIAEELRRAPLAGVGWGLVRHLGSGPAAERLRLRPPAEIAFNYLGRLDEVLAAGGPFAPAPEEAGPQVSPRQARRYRLEIDAAVIGGRLQAAWRYGSRRHRRCTVEELAGRFAAALARFAGAAPGAEPAEPPSPGIELDRVLAELEAAEEVS